MACFLKRLLALFNKQNLTGAIDAPDSRDYIDNLKGRSFSLPAEVDLFERADKIYKDKTGKDLFFKKQGRGDCTSCAFEIVKTITNLCLHGEVIEHDREKHWEMQCDEYGASHAEGATLLSALKVGLKMDQGFPFQGYVKIPKENLHHIKTRLAMGYPIFTGVSWRKTKDGNSNTYYTTKSTGIWRALLTLIVGGHAIAITGYSDITGRVKITESLKLPWGGNIVLGRFEVPYGDVPKMMSMYILRDMRDDV